MAIDLTSQYDAITTDQIRSWGTAKWMKKPGALAAWIAEMDFPLCEPVRAAVTDLVNTGALGYSPDSDNTQLARAYTDFSKRHWGWAPEPGSVHPIPDVLAGLVAVIEAYTTPGTPVIVPTPAYMPFLTLPTYFDRDVIQVPLRCDDSGYYTYDLDALAAAFEQGAELLVLCNPHNPVGRVLTRGELLAIADVVEAKGGLVFADEIHAPIVYPGHSHIPYASLDERTAAHSITAISASKSFNLAGLKCAQIILTNPDHHAAWEKASRWIWASRPGIFANIAAYDQGDEWLEGLVSYLDRNRRRLVELVEEKLPGVRYRMPEGTFLALLDFRGVRGGAGLGDDPTRIIEEKSNVVLNAGPDLGAAAVGMARINIATPLPVLEEVVAAIAKAL
ncbi:MalY/PatB family protein [Dermatophilus congolensis]|uniref:MalY/PatB family protein n=1 Tax=Dermatophilus congolensis TaxID=1863 RepID=UPI00312C7597